MTSFRVYRDGNTKLETTIREAVLHFRQAEGRLPAGIIVNPAELDEAKAVIAGGRGIIPVTSSGGCLQGELWLRLPNSDEKSKLQQAELFGKEARP